MFEPGKSGNPGGRPKGAPNFQTTRIKEFYGDLIEGNLENIQRWLNQTAQENPSKAIELLIKLSPFVIPKKIETDINLESPFNIIIPKKPMDEDL